MGQLFVTSDGGTTKWSPVSVLVQPGAGFNPTVPTWAPAPPRRQAVQPNRLVQHEIVPGVSFHPENPTKAPRLPTRVLCTTPQPDLAGGGAPSFVSSGVVRSRTCNKPLFLARCQQDENRSESSTGAGTSAALSQPNSINAVSQEQVIEAEAAPAIDAEPDTRAAVEPMAVQQDLSSTVHTKQRLCPLDYSPDSVIGEASINDATPAEAWLAASRGGSGSAPTERRRRSRSSSALPAFTALHPRLNMRARQSSP